MLTSRSLGVPSVLVALASLAPLTLAHDVQPRAQAPAKAPPHGTGSGVLVLPEVTLGQMRGTLVDASGKPVYLLRARLEAFHVFVPGLAIGALEGRLYDASGARLVGTLDGVWDEQQGMGRFEAQVHPVGVPDPHHFAAGYLRGRFKLARAAKMQPEELARRRDAATDPWFGPQPGARKKHERDDDHEKEAASPVPPGTIDVLRGPDGGLLKTLSLPLALLRRVAPQMATTPLGGDAGRFELDWWIDGLR